jgi:EAL domain-containing protein (putative c-di-GMP-specific phosphodiesterase class I)/ActR/RegA family two-component response regulator
MIVPCAGDINDEIEVTTSMSASVNAASDRPVSLRVLLVDDEAAIARSLGRLLTAEGHRVTTAPDGGQAFDLIQSSTFDVIVSDIRMPGVDGLSLLRAIRGRDLDVPVVFMTGSPDLKTAVEAVEHGAFRYLVKPFDGKELVDLVGRAGTMHRLARVRREAADEIDGKPIGDRAGLETRFASGLDQMRMAMQPVLSWRHRTVFGYEALLRTEEPTLRNPVDFIDAAERLNRTTELGRRVRKRIASQLTDLPPSASLFVNLHPSDLVDEELWAADGALTAFAPRVVLEVTERAALDQVPGVGAGIRRLRALGFRLALDDLGAGYAGLSSFAQLEPEIVKVDMSLVRGIHESDMKQKLFRSFATLCHDLNTEIIAEGVENVQERDCLTSLGGDLYQGFLFARPGHGFPLPVF